MFKYGRMQKKIPSQLCGCRGVCLDCMLPGSKLPLGWDFFLHLNCLSDSEDSDSLTGLLEPSTQVPSGIVNMVLM